MPLKGTWIRRSVRISVEESLTQDCLPVLFISELEDAITTQCSGTVGIVLKYKQTCVFPGQGNG